MVGVCLYELYFYIYCLQVNLQLIEQLFAVSHEKMIINPDFNTTFKSTKVVI